jgi:hypothetical protein
MRVGSTVRIVEDEFPQLVGVVGTLERFGPDGTTAWVATQHEGVWCSVANLVEEQEEE